MTDRHRYFINYIGIIFDGVLDISHGPYVDSEIKTDENLRPRVLVVVYNNVWPHINPSLKPLMGSCTQYFGYYNSSRYLITIGQSVSLFISQYLSFEKVVDTARFSHMQN